MDAEVGEVKFHLALRHANPRAITDKLYAVSDPASEDYGNHWTQAELKENSQPRPGAVERVTNYLNAVGISNIEQNWCGDILTVRAPVDLVNKLLALDVQTFAHPEVDYTINRATKIWTLPRAIASDVETVFGLL